MKTTVWFLAVAITSILYACDQDMKEANDSAISATSALSTVQDCVKQTHACAAAAKTDDERKACSAQLRVCIQPLAGGKPGDLIADGGIAVPPVDPGTLPPGMGTLPPIGGLPGADAGLPDVDAGRPGIPTAPPAAGALKGIKECLGTLKDCLSASASDPMTCATQVRDCLKSLL